MKLIRKYTALFLTFLLLAGTAIAEYKTFPYLFTGRWQPAEDALIIDQFGYQDIQNLRREGKQLKGVSGHTRVLSSATSFPRINNGFHFQKFQPSESHVLLFTTDTLNTSSRVYESTATIPNASSIDSTIYTPGADALVGRFASVPQGNVLYADGDASKIWGGKESRVVYFTTSSGAVTAATLTFGQDFTSQVQNTRTTSDQVASIDSSGSGTFLIGSYRKLQGVKLYVSTANTSSTTLTVKEWDGSAWAALTVTDGTGGLSATGSVTWASTVDTSKVKYLEGLVLYWYQFNLPAGSASISYVTVDAPWQDVPNIWNAEEIEIGQAKVFNTTTYQDYSDEAKDDDPTTVVVLDALATTHFFYVGFTEAVQGFHIRIPGTKENGTVSVLTVKYWTGTAWAAVTALNDGTAEGGATFAQTGVISFQAVAANTEFPREIAGEALLFYYQMSVSIQLDAEVDLYYITGIPAPESIQPYRFPGEFQNRAWLFNEYLGEKNKARYSASNNPNTWNGADSGFLFFGDETDLTASAVIYNVFRSTGYYQLIVTKANETWRVFGNGPANWTKDQVSSNVGTIAPLSMAVAEISEISVDTKRHVVIWQSDSGVVMFDGAAIIPISDDIRNFWDPHSDDFIPTDRQDDSVGWYDPNLGVYKLLISSGAGQTTHNVELEYSLKYQEWTKIYRENASGANPLQAGFPVRDTTGNTYSYGGTNEGFLYYLNNGTSWHGAEIAYILHTKDLLLDNEMPYFKDTVIEYFRQAFTEKAGLDEDYLLTLAGSFLIRDGADKIILWNTEDVSVDHYCDRTLSLDDRTDLTTGNYQDIVDDLDFDDGPVITQETNLGPCLMHSFKYTGDISSAVDGFEPTGLGLWYDTQETVSGVIGD